MTIVTDTLVQVPLKDIVRCRWRDEEDSPDKIRVAKERISRQGFRGHLDGRLLLNGQVEQLNGHNRRAACEEMGFATLPFVVKDYTDEEALDIFLSDNMKEDGQSTGWALGAVRKVVPYLTAQGKALSEAYAIVGSKIGLDSEDVVKLSEMNDALDTKVLSPQVKRLLVPYNAIEYWRKLNQLMLRRSVTLDEQGRHVEEILRSPDVRGRIRTYFCDLLAEAGPAKVVQPRTKRPPFPTACKHFEQLITLLRAHGDDFSEEERKAISDKAKYMLALLPDATQATSTAAFVAPVAPVSTTVDINAIIQAAAMEQVEVEDEDLLEEIPEG